LVSGWKKWVNNQKEASRSPQCCDGITVENLRDKRFTELTTDLGSVANSNFGEVVGPLQF